MVQEYMTDNASVDKKKEQYKQSKNKKMLLWGIIELIVVLIGYVIYESVDNKKEFRLASNVRENFPSTVSSSSSSSSSPPSYESSSSSSPSSSSSSSSSSPSSSSSSSTPSRSSSAPSSSSMSVSLPSPVTENASAVRKELANLFRTYA